MTDFIAPTRVKTTTLYGLGAVVLLALWSAASIMTEAYIIPSPWHTAIEVVSLLSQGHAWKQILISVTRVVAGFSLALFAGLIVGIVSGSNQDVQTLFRPLILVVQGMPPLLWIIPFILVLGIGDLSPICVIALICFPIVALNISEGVKTVPSRLTQMLDMFAPGTYPRIRELVLPHLKPFIAASLKLGIMLAIKASVIAEYFGANDGIGFQVQAAFQSLQVAKLFAWGIIFIILILVAGCLLERLERFMKHPDRRQEPKGEAGPSPELTGKLKATFVMRSSTQRLVLHDVSFAYPGTGVILDHINLTVRSGEIVVISGDSGVGKTTLLHTAAGLLKPLSGTVTGPERLGIVFQDERLLSWRSNAWNVALPLIYSRIKPEPSLTCANYLLSETGLSGWEQAVPEELSGGMKKRLAFARCIARTPDAVLLDEPFNGLDAVGRRCLWNKFMALLDDHHGPVLIVTHFPEEIPSSERCRFLTLAPSRRGTTGVQLFPFSAQLDQAGE
jgi:ABC-type nitrate/sulfonate/bicarbonate transport system permease component/ABC-type nitrate/sulfonate/bicarbonate transport system ATPase subunit